MERVLGDDKRRILIQKRARGLLGLKPVDVVLVSVEGEEVVLRKALQPC